MESHKFIRGKIEKSELEKKKYIEKVDDELAIF
jgi:hypothetical protein